MPRTARPPHEPNSVLHVISRGVEQRSTFLSDDDRNVFLSMLRVAFRKYGVGLLAYCLMGNHFHLLVTVSTACIGVPMHLLLTRYSQYFNRKYQRVGHLFQDRFKAILCLHSDYLVNLVAYIHLNPVRAGMVKTPAAWGWSSHAEFVVGRGVYLDFDRFETATGMTVDELRDRYADRLSPTRPLLSVDELIRQAAYVAGVDSSGVMGARRGGDYTKARRILVGWATEEGISLADLARKLGCSPEALSLLKKGVPPA